MANACGGQVERDRRTESAEADKEDASPEQAFLPLDVDLRQHDLAAVAQQLPIIHRRVSARGWPVAVLPDR